MLEGWWLHLLLLGEWTLRLVMVIVILSRRDGRSASTLPWIVVVLLVPLLGMVLYVALGMTRLGRGRIERHRAIVASFESPEVMVPLPLEALATDLPREPSHLAAMAERFGAPPACRGNRLQLMGDTDLTIQHMVEDIDAAADHVHILTYIYLDDETGQRVGRALASAVARGVQCRLLVDGLGSRPFLRSPLATALRRAGVHVAEALPIHGMRLLAARIDLRNHRKITVIDGSIGYTGSQNIANADFAPKRHYAPWVDAMVRIDGPVVRDLQTLFVEDWYLDTGESLEALLRLVPRPHPDGVAAQVIGTGPNTPPIVTRMILQAAVQTAQSEVVFTTPYFVPDDATVLALATAASRGVSTHVIVPARNDSRLVSLASRGYYEPLLDTGVAIHEYHGGLLHAKTVSVDRDFALVTSANIDRRSFDLNFEAGLMVFDDDFASSMRFLQQLYLDSSTSVHPASWRNRPRHQRLAQAAAGLFAPLL